MSQVLENVVQSTGTRANRLVVGECVIQLLLFSFFRASMRIGHISMFIRCIEYLVVLIYGRSATIRVPDRTDKAGTAAERSGPGTGGSASPAAKTRTSGDWRATRGKDCECTASTTPFRYITTHRPIRLVFIYFRLIRGSRNNIIDIVVKQQKLTMCRFIISNRHIHIYIKQSARLTPISA